MNSYLGLKRGNGRKTALWLGASLLLGITAWTLWGNTAPETSLYEISSPRIPASFDGFRIAHISDFHNTELGENHSRVMKLLREGSPDIIVITGDLIDSRRTDVETALSFVRLAAELAPVYYVPGNHESRVSEYRDLKQGLLALGVTVLENEKTALVRAGEKLTLLGMMDPDFGRPGMDLAGEKEGYTLLLSHRPERFGEYVASGVDLVFSGHAHGGQARLPFIGGVIAPHQGFFPEYDAGVFSSGNTTMVVSRGLGNSAFPLRFNNRPELVIVELKTGI